MPQWTLLQDYGKIKANCEEVAALGQRTKPACITQHPGFASVCLGVWVLQFVYNEYKQRYGHIDKPLFELVDILSMPLIIWYISAYSVKTDSHETLKYSKQIRLIYVKLNI